MESEGLWGFLGATFRVESRAVPQLKCGWLTARPGLTAGYVNLYFTVPGALLGPALPVCGLGSPAASFRVLFASKEGDLVWGLQKPGHEDHVSLLWESGGNGRRQLPALASLQPSGVTQLSWPTCAVLSWRRKS